MTQDAANSRLYFSGYLLVHNLQPDVTKRMAYNSNSDEPSNPSSRFEAARFALSSQMQAGIRSCSSFLPTKTPVVHRCRRALQSQKPIFQISGLIRDEVLQKIPCGLRTTHALAQLQLDCVTWRFVRGTIQEVLAICSLASSKETRA